MEEQPIQATPPKTNLQFGLLIGVVSIVLFLVFYLLQVGQSGFIRWIPTLVYVVLVIVTQQVHAQAVRGQISYGDLFALGFKTVALATLILVVFMILFNILDPGLKNQALEQARKQMDSNPNLTQDQRTNALNITRKFFMVFLIGITILFNLIFGLIASLIGALIPNKKPVPPKI